MTWSLALLPLCAGLLLWAWQAVAGRRSVATTRLVLAGGAASTLVALGALAGWATVLHARAEAAFGAGLVLSAELTAEAGVVTVLVPVIALPIVVYAVWHEEAAALPRLVGLLLVFTGAMELLVVAADLLTLLIGWELVGALSWALIGYEWEEIENPQQAAHAFNATRFGDLGLFVAAGAAFASVGSLSYAELTVLDGTALDVFAGGILLAAAAKSAQVVFAPWLFSAMAGPTPVSALLHAATMVAAGPYLLVRLFDVLDGAPWFGPATLAIGLMTALAAGAVGALQHHAKRLLAASTSAQYGLMFVAVGAGYPLVALIHLVAHAALKALLFLSAGVGQAATGSYELARMRLGSRLPVTALLTLVGSLALAAIPPLGAAWSKERVVAAATHEAVWLGVVTLGAGALSAVYATRFQLLAFGPTRSEQPSPRPLVRGPYAVETGALAYLAALCVGLGALWWPASRRALEDWTGSVVPAGATWEVVASLALAAAAIYAVWAAGRRQRLLQPTLLGPGRAVAEWFGLPTAVRRVVVDPSLALAHALARFDDRVVDAGVGGVAVLAGRAAGALARSDDRVVDAGVRGVAALTGWAARVLAGLGELGVDGSVRLLVATVAGAGRDTRRLQTGMLHQYYIIVAVGVSLAFVVAAVWR
ncbi:MAG: NADH-quinone oxidoreductase subunit 5 family protein [Egibacteraceae bacterium]